ncbi:MAG: hypothetical protein Fur0010_13050 [Bdellovibrio sp.]
MFNDFMSEIKLKKASATQSSAFFVDHASGTIKLVTGFNDFSNRDDEILSFGMDECGEVVVLSSEA